VAAPGADALSMFMLAVPLLVLFFAAIGVCIFNDKRRDSKASKRVEETEASADIATPLEDLNDL
jgi:sec-independent protein translocase protein TatC